MLISLHDKEVCVCASVFYSVHNGVVHVGHQLCKVGNADTNRIDGMHF